MQSLLPKIPRAIYWGIRCFLWFILGRWQWNGLLMPDNLKGPEQSIWPSPLLKSLAAAAVGAIKSDSSPWMETILNGLIAFYSHPFLPPFGVSILCFLRNRPVELATGRNKRKWPSLSERFDETGGGKTKERRRMLL